MFLIWLVGRAVQLSAEYTAANDDVKAPRLDAVSSIPSCSANIFLRDGCYDFVYTPTGDPIVEQVVASMRLNNPGRIIPPERVKGFPTFLDADQWLFQNWGLTPAAVHFSTPGTPSQPTTTPLDVGYTLQTNSTVKYFKGNFEHPNKAAQIPLQVAVERVRVRTGGHAGVYMSVVHPVSSPVLCRSSSGSWRQAASWGHGTWALCPSRTRLMSFAHPPAEAVAVIGSTAPTFVFAAAVFSMVVAMHGVLVEKECGIRSIMQLMGLGDSPYWLSWWLAEGLWALYNAAAVMALGHAFRFQLVVNNSFALVFCLVFLAFLSVTSFGQVPH